MDGIIGVMAANEVRIEGTDEKANLFDYHVKADAILFRYTTPDGRKEVVKFPLAGFCEKISDAIHEVNLGVVGLHRIYKEQGKRTRKNAAIFL